jgi:hypothetical protein
LYITIPGNKILPGIFFVRANVEANYFFTIIKYSAPRNPAFDLFSKIIPLNLFYLLPGLFILWIYIPLISLPWNLKKWFRKANTGFLKF